MRKNYKVGYIGRKPVFVSVEYTNNALSITGVVNPNRCGNCDSCGQIISDLREIDTPTGEWTQADINQLLFYWERWHLNDMRAGSQVQEDYLRKNPVSAHYPESYYDKASVALAEAGINPDADGYKYGSAWKFEAVPARVISWLFSFEMVDDLPVVWAR